MHIGQLTYIPCIRKNPKSNYENDKDMKDSLNGVTIEYLDQEIYVNHTLLKYSDFCQKYEKCIISPGLDKIEAGLRSIYLVGLYIRNIIFALYSNLGYIDVGDRCWRWFMLVPPLRFWWPILNISKVTNILKLSRSSSYSVPTKKVSS